VTRAAGTTIAVIVLALAGGAARAQGNEVPAWIEVVKKQPAGVERTAWKEQRREAARKLGASGDKRAVTVLIELADKETFDIIGEIAIDGLGQLGDPAAVPVLQKIAADRSRDTVQRDKAKKALARLGARPEPAAGGGAPLPDVGDHATRDGAAITTTEPAAEAPEPATATLVPTTPAPASGPMWGDDILAKTERLTFVIGTAAFEYDTVRDRATFDLDGRSSYQRTQDRDRNAWRYGADLRVVAGTTNPDGPAKARNLIGAAGGHGEFRAYGGSDLYGIAFGQARLEGSRLSTTDDDGNQNSDRWLALDAQVAFGGGFGRVLDVGTRMRVARIATALERSRALGRPIDDEVARRLQSAWWALRGRLGSHQLLITTIAILRDAGILLGEPDASTTYELLQILDDPAFDGRASGFDLHVAFGEGFLKRWRWPEAEASGALDAGRLEELLLRARWVKQVADQSDLAVALWARKRLFTPDDGPAPWAAALRVEARRWVYADHFDPRGALDVAGEVGASDDDVDDTDLGVRLAGELGWTVIVSRASSLRLSADAAFDSGELFVGARLAAAYGLLDGAYAKSPP